MESELTWLAAFGIGLVGSGHCLGMCGGIAGALGMSARQASPGAAGAAAYALLFNLGRVGSYTLIGALAGWLGGSLGSSIDLPAWSALARSLTGLVMVAIGLQLALGWRLLAFVEHGGARVWARLAPLARRLMPARRPADALLLGMLWGWLPCGLVYSVLLMALVAGDPAGSAMLMAAFGIGTLPSMTATALASSRLNPASRPGLRRAAGALMIVFGLWTAAWPLSHLGGSGDGGHHHHAARPAGNGTAIVLSISSAVG
jgi:hypothetical protein